MAFRVVVGLLFLACMTGISAAQDIEIQIDSQTDTAYGLAWNPDGTILAVASGYELTLYSADLETVLAAATGEPFVNVDWSPDGTQLATVSGYRHPDIVIWDWDADAGEIEQAATLEGDARTIDSAWRARNQYGVAWGEEGLISLADDRQSRFQIWDVASETVVDFHDAGYAAPLYQFTRDSDGTAMFAAGREAEEDSLTLYRLDFSDGSGEILFPLPEETWVIGFSTDYRYAAAAAATGEVTIIDLNNGENVHRFTSHAEPVDIAWHGDQFAILSYKDGLQIWDLSGELP